MLDRRAVTAGLLSAGMLRRVHAAVPAAHKIGDITVRVLDDGHMMMPIDRLAAADFDEAALRSILAAEKIAGPQTRFAVNVTLLEIGAEKILIDAGAGGTWFDTAGKLGDSLAAAKIDPAAIGHVVLTHAHPDHLWGVIDDFDDKLRFPNAAYSIPAREFEFWMSPTAPETARVPEGVIAGARRVLKRIEPRLSRLPVATQVLPGLAYVDAGGHTPGQCAVLVASGREKLLVATDTLFHPIISMRYPQWQPAQDMDGNAAVAARLRMLDIAAGEQALVVAYHIAGGLGRIEKVGANYAWVSV